jgi:membrane protease YdiL (CAAX protease family)
VLAAIATYLVVPALVPAGLAMIVAQAMLVVIPAGGVVLGRLGRPLAVLGLRGARPRFFIAAIAIGATAWFVNLWLVALLPLPGHEAKVLEALVERPSLAGAIALFAVVPAVCEEILFRGVLARALGRHLPLAGAAAISALVFAAYHVSIVQALPTLTLGFVLAVIAIRADSVLPTIVAHALNNTMAITLSRGALPALAGWIAGHPSLALAGCATTTAIGVAITARSRAT